VSVDERAVSGAKNNADLYEAMFRSHGLAYERWPFAFVGRDRPPPYYSNLTVLSHDSHDDVMAQLADLASRFEGAVGVKDSFCRLRLEGNGFRTLFEASWIWRAPENHHFPGTWRVVDSPDDLISWEESWKKNGSPTQHRMFPGPMLDLPDMFFLGSKNGDTFEAGCIANTSEACIGISNVFSTSPSAEAFAEAAAAVSAIDPRLPVVGYEAGRELDYARRAGFETVGDLRILVSKAAVF